MVSATVTLNEVVSSGKMKISYYECRLFVNKNLLNTGKWYVIYIWLELERDID
jgi:hypothetical protein